MSDATPFIVDVVKARGHPNIRAAHKTTLELTKEPHVTPRGDCIIGVNSSKSAAELEFNLKKALQNSQWLILILYLPSLGIYDYLIANGAPTLQFTDSKSIVVRRSTYVDGRTIAINSNKAARDLNPLLREHLQNSNTILEAILIATKDPQQLASKIEYILKQVTNSF
ncbi:MAG: DUF371 domain-containing protein [Infirmifilum sp.]